MDELGEIHLREDDVEPDADAIVAWVLVLGAGYQACIEWRWGLGWSLQECAQLDFACGGWRAGGRQGRAAERLPRRGVSATVKSTVRRRCVTNEMSVSHNTTAKVRLWDLGGIGAALLLGGLKAASSCVLHHHLCRNALIYRLHRIEDCYCKTIPGAV